MTKRQMIRELAAAQGLPQTQVRRVLDAFLEQIATQLEHTGRVELHGLGVLLVHQYPAYQFKGPDAEQPIQQPAYKRVTFRASSKLKTKLNQHE